MKAADPAAQQRRFLRFSLRELLLLLAVTGALLAIISPRLQRAYSARRGENVSQALVEAAADGNLEAVRKAIAAGADLNARDGQGNTPLECAMRAKDLPLMDLLLEAGASPNFQFELDLHPLTFAVQNDDIAAARRLLEAGATPNQGDLIRVTVQNQSSEMLKLLLEYGLEINTGTQINKIVESGVPTNIALRQVRFLLDHGAKVEGEAGEKAMDVLIRHSSYPPWRAASAPVLDLLREYGAPYSAREAVAFDRLDHVKQMVADDPAVLHTRCAPSFAVKPGQEPTLLGIALERGFREMATFLLDAGAPVDGLEEHNQTLLHKAAAGGDPELIRLLLDRGLDVNAKAERGATPLNWAIGHGRTGAVAVLIEAGADVNARDVSGSTPLQSAASGGYRPIVELLLAAGADPSIADEQGQTAYDAARLRNRTDLLPLLKPTPNVAADSRQTAKRTPKESRHID